MSPFSWTVKQLALFWVGAVALAALLLSLGALHRPKEWRLFWLFPYPDSLSSAVRLVWSVLRDAFIARPWEATALVAVPAVALPVTVAWAVARLWSRFY